MSYPSVTFTEMLSNATRAELEFFASLLQGYLSQEHNEDGEHTNISADNIEVVGDGDFGGDLVVDGDADIDGVHIGAAGNSGNGHVGIRLRTSATGTNLIREFHVVSDVESIIGARLAFYDKSGDRDMAHFRWNNGRTAYEFIPDATSKADRTLSIGSPTDGSQGGWWHDCYISDIYTGNNSTNIVGAWTAVAHAGGNFTADVGSWTVDSGDQLTLAYTLTRKHMTVAFRIATSDVSGAANTLRIAIPGGFTAAKAMDNACVVNDAGTVGMGLVSVEASGTTLNIIKVPVAAFTITAADNTGVRGQITFEIA